MQRLFDDLWSEGFRPNEDLGPFKHIEKHLDDMRRLVFGQIGAFNITPPELISRVAITSTENKP